MSQTLLEMTKDLVEAQIQAHGLEPEGLHALLQETHTTLLTLRAAEASLGREATVSPKRQPSRNWQKSIAQQWVTCLECGVRLKQLTARHLNMHDLDGRLYRHKYGMPPHQPLSARFMSALRRQIMRNSKPWEKTQKYREKQQKERPTLQKKKVRLRKAPKSKSASAGSPKRASRKRTS